MGKPNENANARILVKKLQTANKERKVKRQELWATVTTQEEFEATRSKLSKLYSDRGLAYAAENKGFTA
jgi:hypothetical protein